MSDLLDNARHRDGRHTAASWARDYLLLIISLQASVPLHLHEQRHWSAEQLRAVAAKSASTIAAHGDDLQFGGRQCAHAFSALAVGLAAAAHAPGGVDFAGQHWCTQPHTGCPHRTDTA